MAIFVAITGLAIMAIFLKMAIIAVMAYFDMATNRVVMGVYSKNS